MSLFSLPETVFSHGIAAAVSGGADSTAMLCCLNELCPDKSKLAVVHINHNLRGKESDGDALFVKQLAERFQLRCFEKRIEPEQKLSEETARNIRYDFLIQTAQQIGFRYLAAAHTADDQTETVLHRIIRGTGLSGLAGIAPQRQLTQALTLLRPMMSVRRRKIIEYLKLVGQEYRTDSTNLKNDFTRNKIRNRLLPELRSELNPQIDEAVNKLAQLAADNESVQNELLDELLDTIILHSGQTERQIVLDGKKLCRFTSAARRSLLVRLWKRYDLPMRAMTFEHWSSLADFTNSDAERLELPGSVQVEWENVHPLPKFIINVKWKGYTAPFV